MSGKTFHHEPPLNQLNDMGISTMSVAVQMVLTRPKHALYHLARFELYGDMDDLDAYRGQVGQCDAQDKIELDRLTNSSEFVNLAKADIKARAKKLFTNGKIGG